MSTCNQLSGVCENCQANANLPSSARQLQCTSSCSFANRGAAGSWAERLDLRVDAKLGR